MGSSATLTDRMTRGTVVAVWCTAELRTVLMGAHFPTPYNAPLMAAVGAVVLGIVFTLAAWGLIRIFSDQLPKRPG